MALFLLDTQPARHLNGGEADAAYRLNSRLCCTDLPDQWGIEVTDADSMLEAIVRNCSRQGQWFAEPCLLRQLFWWCDLEPVDVAEWLFELVDRGDVEVVHDIARNAYDGPDHDVPILQVLNMERYDRWKWKNRPPIPTALRRQVLERDEHACVRCGATKRLELDHVHPWSKGGRHSFENLQVLCRPCNARKYNKVGRV